MKKMILLFAMLISAVTVFAQGAVTSEPSTAGFVIDLGTFTGIVALISAIVTQILKDRFCTGSVTIHLQL